MSAAPNIGVRPKNLTVDGQKQWGADPHDFEFFRVFWFFREAANHHLEADGPVRIQEISDTEIRGERSSDEPAYGRRYEIFYNKVMIGRLQIKASPFWDEDKSVRAHIDINRVPITALPYANLRSFLCVIAELLTRTKPQQGDQKSEYEQAIAAIDWALAEAMWDTLNDQTLGDPPGNYLELNVRGTPELYFRMAAREAKKRREAQAGQTSAHQSA